VGHAEIYTTPARKCRYGAGHLYARDTTGPELDALPLRSRFNAACSMDDPEPALS
jgi:hypothetical protein